MCYIFFLNLLFYRIETTIFNVKQKKRFSDDILSFINNSLLPTAQNLALKHNMIYGTSISGLWHFGKRFWQKLNTDITL